MDRREGTTGRRPRRPGIASYSPDRTARQRALPSGSPSSREGLRAPGSFARSRSDSDSGIGSDDVTAVGARAILRAPSAAMDPIGKRDGLSIGGPSEMRRTSIRGLLAAILILGACSPAPSPRPSIVAPSASPSATVTTADTIRISMPSGSLPTRVHGPPTGVGPLSNSNFQAPRPYSDPGSLLRMVHAALYRFNDQMVPVPDLAADPCDISP